MTTVFVDNCSRLLKLLDPHIAVRACLDLKDDKFLTPIRT
jgi:hypothetical protein